MLLRYHKSDKPAIGKQPLESLTSDCLDVIIKVFTRYPIFDINNNKLTGSDYNLVINKPHRNALLVKTSPEEEASFSQMTATSIFDLTIKNTLKSLNGVSYHHATR